MKDLPDDDPPPPPLVVPAARELSRFGWSWIALGIALLVAAFATGSTGTLDGGELALVLVLLGLSLGCVLGAMLLARRTGPEIAYYRILDMAPPPPDAPCESAGATTRRVLPPAVGIAFFLVWAALVGVGTMLALGGEPRSGIRDDLPGATLIVAAGWTLTCGLASLRMATYFIHWERMRDALVLCRPLKAGTMRPVYWVARESD